jgi:hypothetical protein
MSERASENSEMTTELAFASEAMRSKIAPVGSAQYVETRIRKAARLLNWRFSRARDVWYADPRVSLKARELRDIETVAGVQYGRAELRTNDQLIAQADALLEGVHEDFHRPFVAAFRAFFGALDRSGAGGRNDD